LVNEFFNKNQQIYKDEFFENKRESASKKEQKQAEQYAKDRAKQAAKKILEDDST